MAMSGNIRLQSFVYLFRSLFNINLGKFRSRTAFLGTYTYADQRRLFFKSGAFDDNIA